MQNIEDTSFDENDINSYSDERIANYLRKLRTKNLSELLEAQKEIEKKFADASQEYESQRTEIRWARRRYWLFIIVNLFVDLWLKFHEKETIIEELKNNKIELQQNYEERQEELNEKSSLVTYSKNAIEDYSREIDKASKELVALQETIEDLSSKYYNLSDNETDNEYKHLCKTELDSCAQQRDLLKISILELNAKIDNLFQALCGVVVEGSHITLTSSVLISQFEATQQKLASLKERCENGKHPIIPKLLNFLKYRTTSSIKALKDTMSSDSSYLESRELVSLVKAAGEIDSSILENWKEDEQFATIDEMHESYTRMTQALKQTIEKLTKQRELLIATIKIAKTNMWGPYQKACTIISKYSHYSVTPNNYFDPNNSDLDDSSCEQVNFGYISRETIAAIESSVDYELYSTCRKSVSLELKIIREQASALEKINEQLTINKELLSNTTNLDERLDENLIAKCNKISHPVAVALAKFLDYPTTRLLEKLQLEMQNQPNYVHNQELVKLLNTAKVYYPFINNNSPEIKTTTSDKLTTDKPNYGITVFFRSLINYQKDSQQNSDESDVENRPGIK